MLVDDFDRTDSSRLEPGETTFGLYNRSARPEFARVRDLLDRAAKDYPAEERKDLVARLRFRAPYQVASAEFELLKGTTPFGRRDTAYLLLAASKRVDAREASLGSPAHYGSTLKAR
ncbi:MULTISPECIES: hypothetical protein [unclassified Pseudoxanthomonas]|uniref:hypothetical protein n=1 Tax=unclassified Pseudoxanthomonas TaxID=2645906 RepID=UPI0008E2F124|nr:MULTISPECIES: hypothetical protein [unclassified Pseudoxanthomonas]PPJ43941.1 hypothetical protein C0063_12490 [Pseudoxanthomonas sp. KAs_5_3]SFV25910.1 hypothetical protein SAMN05428990_0019 [Pseudoxanthomonas sp. YR558]